MLLKCLVGNGSTINKVNLYTCLAHFGSVSETAFCLTFVRVNKPGNYWDVHWMLNAAHSAINCCGKSRYLLKPAFFIHCKYSFCRNMHTCKQHVRSTIPGSARPDTWLISKTVKTDELGVKWHCLVYPINYVTKLIKT